MRIVQLIVIAVTYGISVFSFLYVRQRKICDSYEMCMCMKTDRISPKWDIRVICKFQKSTSELILDIFPV